jgi:hypothetical protein
MSCYRIFKNIKYIHRKISFLFVLSFRFSALYAGGFIPEGRSFGINGMSRAIGSIGSNDETFFQYALASEAEVKEFGFMC